MIGALGSMVRLAYEAARLEGPHWLRPEPEEGRDGYWREFLKCSDDNIVTGTGKTREEAELNARNHWQEREDYLALPARDRLRVLNAKKELCPRDVHEAVKLLMELALQYPV